MTGRIRHKGGCRIVEHEADVGLVLTGPTLEALFGAGAYGLFSLLFDLRKVRGRETKVFSITASGDSLVEFLNELLYLWDAERFITKDARVERTGDTFCATVRGETFDHERHRVHKEVKAVTYHGFEVKKTGDGFEARLILDI